MKSDSCSFNSPDMDMPERDGSASLTAIFASDVTTTDTIRNLVAITPENDDGYGTANWTNRSAWPLK